MILPGVGTAIGAGIGALAGKTKSQKDKEKQEIKNQEELAKMKNESVKRQQKEQCPSDLDSKPHSSEKIEHSDSKIYPDITPIAIKYENHEVVIIRTASTLGLHIKKNEAGQIYVSSIVPDSDAEKSNIFKDDLITQINNTQLTTHHSLADCSQLMANSKEYVDLKLQRPVQNKHK